MMNTHQTLPLSTTELYRNDMKFSAAHFTIFSKTERERLHGHNYYIHTSITSTMHPDGMTYDYSITRKHVLALCRSLNEYLLLPQKSPYLTITEQNAFYLVRFHDETMYFLKTDTRLLPVENTSSECLAQWFVNQLTQDKIELAKKNIVTLTVSIEKTQGQSSKAQWNNQALRGCKHF